MKKLVIITVLWGCAGPDVPETPTYEEHVRPILEANCVRCHADPLIGGVPDDPVPIFLETREQAEENVIELNQRVQEGGMPPNYTLEDWQLDVIHNWCATLQEEQFCL
jgi:uncharacterized membrane protein